MIPGQDAESAGVDRHRVVEPEFRAEVRDRTLDELRMVVREPGRFVGALSVHLSHEAVVHLEKGWIARDGTETLGMDASQYHDRIVSGEVPQRLVDRCKQ